MMSDIIRGLFVVRGACVDASLGRGLERRATAGDQDELILAVRGDDQSGDLIVGDALGVGHGTELHHGALARLRDDDPPVGITEDPLTQEVTRLVPAHLAVLSALELQRHLQETGTGEECEVRDDVAEVLEGTQHVLRAQHLAVRCELHGVPALTVAAGVAVLVELHLGPEGDVVTRQVTVARPERDLEDHAPVVVPGVLLQGRRLLGGDGLGAPAQPVAILSEGDVPVLGDQLEVGVGLGVDGPTHVHRHRPVGVAVGVERTRPGSQAARDDDLGHRLHAAPVPGTAILLGLDGEDQREPGLLPITGESVHVHVHQSVAGRHELLLQTDQVDGLLGVGQGLDALLALGTVEGGRGRVELQGDATEVGHRPADLLRQAHAEGIAILEDVGPLGGLGAHTHGLLGLGGVLSLGLFEVVQAPALGLDPRGRQDLEVCLAQQGVDQDVRRAQGLPQVDGLGVVGHGLGHGSLRAVQNQWS